MREAPRRADAPVFSSCARRLAKRASAKRRKMRPRTGPEYSPALRPELARNWSAAAQRRFSSAWLASSFSVGATQRMVPPSGFYLAIRRAPSSAADIVDDVNASVRKCVAFVRRGEAMTENELKKLYEK